MQGSDVAQPAKDGTAALSSMLTIGGMSRRYGLTLRALRFYEDRGLIHPLRHGTARFYDREACRRIDMIQRGKQLGYSLKAIAAMLDDGGAEMDGSRIRDAREVQQQIVRLERKRQELDTALAELHALQRRSIGRRAADAESVA